MCFDDEISNYFLKVLKKNVVATEELEIQQTKCYSNQIISMIAITTWDDFFV